MNFFRITITAIILFLSFQTWALDTQTLYEQGIEAFNSGNYSSAELVFRKLIDLDDIELRDRSWFYLARSIYHQKNYKLAVFEFNSFLNKCRTTTLCAESRYWIGESYYNLNEYSKAIEEFKRYLLNAKSGRLSGFAHDRIGSIYFSQQRYDEAIIEWEKGIQASDNKIINAHRLYRIGEALFLSGNYDKALTRLKPLLTSDGDPKIVAMVRILYGRIYQIKDKHRLAIKYFNMIPDDLLKLYPYYEIHYFLASSYINLEKNAIAQTHLNLFFLIGKESTWYYDALYLQAQLHLAQDNEKEAISVLEKIKNTSIKQNLKIKASLQLSSIFLKKEPEKAIPYLEESLRIEEPEEYKRIILYLGKAYIRVKRFDDAERVLSIYLEKYPFDKNVDEVIFLKARMNLEKGDMQTATELFTRLKKEHPFSDFINETNYYLALVNHKNNSHDEALRRLYSYLKNKKIKHRYEANKLIVEIYLKQNNFLQAQKNLNSIIREFRDNKDIDELLFYFITQSGSNKSRTSYYRSLLFKKYPKSRAAMNLHFILGSLAFKEKKYAEAIEQYSFYLKSDFEADRGIAYFNTLISLYELEKYETLLEMIDTMSIPPLDVNQWKQIPLIISRSHYHLKQYGKVYQRLYHEKFNEYPPEDILMFIDCAARLGDIESAKNVKEYLENSNKHIAQADLIIGDYYLENGDNDTASEYYLSVLKIYNKNSIADRAKLRLTRIMIEKGEFDTAEDYLNKIQNKEHLPEKYVLSIKLAHAKGNSEDAAKQTDQHLGMILQNAGAEEILRLNIAYSYEKNDSRSMNKYAKLLSRFKGNANFINYYRGELYYKQGSYKKAYYYYNKTSVNDNEYRLLSLYKMAEINLLIYRNLRRAESYYQEVIKINDLNSKYLWKAKINLAIMYFEMHKDNEAIELLTEILVSEQRGEIRSQALNLLELHNTQKGG